MAKSPISEKEVNQIINAPKFIDNPKVTSAESACDLCKVYMDDGSDHDLIFRYYGNGTSLLLRSARIRGFDWKVRRHSGECAVIRGWHEHLYDDLYADNKIVEAIGLRHLPHNADARIVIAFSLKHWNIDIKGSLAGLLDLRGVTQ